MKNDQEHRTQKSSLKGSCYNLHPIANSKNASLNNASLNKKRNNSINYASKASELPPINNIQNKDDAIKNNRSKTLEISKTLEVNLKPKEPSINPFPNSRILKSPKNTQHKEASRRKPNNTLLKIDTTKPKIGNIIHFPVPKKEKKTNVDKNESLTCFKPYSPDSRIKKYVLPTNKKKKCDEYKGNIGDISGWPIKKNTSKSFF